MSAPGVWQVYEDKAGEWRWRLKAGNHEIVADSAEGYTTKWEAVAATSRVSGLIRSMDEYANKDAERVAPEDTNP